MTLILHAKQIEKVYGSKKSLYPVLKELDLKIYKQEFVAIMGPSGAGKTTLLNILATIDQPTSGKVFINNEEITKLDKNALARFRSKELGFIFQDFNLLDSLTIGENILLPLALLNEEPAVIDERTYEITKVLGIDSILDKYPYETSGGQKQRAAAARAMIMKPSIVLADEPTGSLDSKSATDLLTSFKTLNTEYETTILMVTHDAFAASYCDRVVFIKDGRLYTELHKGDKSRKEFFEQLLLTLSSLGGGSHELV